MVDDQTTHFLLGSHNVSIFESEIKSNESKEDALKEVNFSD